MYDIKLYDSINHKGVIYTNIRNFQFTYSRGKSGNANFTFDMSPKSLQVQAGWLVEIYRYGKLLYWGQIIKRQKKKGKIKLFSHDAIGILNQRILSQRPVTKQEASLEVIEKLDGLELVKGFKLTADKYIKKTGTERFWHWESNKYGDYIKDIGEQVKNISGESKLFTYWITPYREVIFEEEGSRGYIDNLQFASMTIEENITSTYNKIVVEGLPILKIPYDGDFWTEYLSSEHWQLGVTSDITEETVNGNSVSTSSNWSNTSNVTGDYDDTYTTTSSTSNSIEVAMTNFTASSATNIGNIQISLKAKGDSSQKLTVYLDRVADGLGYCNGHEIASSLTDTNTEYSVVCEHSQGSPSNSTDLQQTFQVKAVATVQASETNTVSMGGSTASGWTNSSYAIGDDSNYAYTSNSGSSALVIHMKNFSLDDFSSLESYTVYINGKKGNSAMSNWTVYVSKDGGSSYCSGHSISPPTSDGTVNFTCSHSNAPSTESELENNDLVIKIVPPGDSELYIDNNIYVDNVKHEIEYNITSSTSANTLYLDGIHLNVNYESTATTTASFSFDNDEKYYQARSLKNESHKTSSSNFTTHTVSFTKNIASSEGETNSMNLENVTSCNFAYRYGEGSSGTISSLDSINVIFIDVYNNTRIWEFTPDDPGTLTWDTSSLDLTFNYVDSSSNFDITQVKQHGITYKFTISSTTSSYINVWLDNYYFEQSPYSYTAYDNDSINKYGTLEKKYIMRNFYSNSDCESMAELLLDNLKSVKYVINVSLSSFIEIYPNTLLKIVDTDGTIYKKSLLSITYYVNADGSESAQLTLGDFRKDDIEVITEKLAEINVNNNLLINPYKLT